MNLEQSNVAGRRYGQYLFLQYRLLQQQLQRENVVTEPDRAASILDACDGFPSPERERRFVAAVFEQARNPVPYQERKRTAA